MINPLPRSFYDRDPNLVAQDLLGKVLVRNINKKILKGVIVEVEAYLSLGDEAAHGFKGKNQRNQSLYKEAGHAYVHSMRHHFLLDLVTEGVNVPSSVLIRAVQPIDGISVMKKSRGTDVVENLANGPGKFCVAFNIDKTLDGIDMTTPLSSLYVTESENLEKNIRIATSKRIGISRSQDMLLRFWIKENPFVSRKRKI